MRSFLTTLGSLIVATPLIASGLSFTGPEVLKLDWSTRALSVSDIDNDGLNDLALINQDTAQIELLYQLADGDSTDANKKRISRNRWDPVLEDARFDSDGVAVGFPVFDLAVGDLNGDGLKDMAYTSREVPLTIRYQTDSGQWSDLTEFDNFAALGWTGTIKIQDLNADGRAEIIVVASDGVRVFKHDTSGKLQEPDLFYLTGENPYNLMLEDLDEDGLTDILYITASGKQSLVMREQLDDGGFGPERRFIFDRPVRIVQPMPRTENAPLQFCSVDSRSGSLDFFELRLAGGAGESGEAILQPHVYPIFKKGRNPASYAMGDLDGDGDEDLLIANPTEAEVVLFLKDETGFEAPKHFPSFSSISSMASGHFYNDTPAHVVMVSAEEKTIGRSMIGTAERLIFPKTLSIDEGDPVACEVVDLDRDGLDELVLITDQKGKYSLSILVPSDRDAIGSAFEVVHEVKLAGVKRKPTGLLPLDIFGGDRSGLMVFVPREAPLLFATESSSLETLSEVAAESAIRQNLLKDIQPSQVSVFDVNGDGLSELVVGRKGYARALKVVDGELEMVDQFNARQGEDDISVVLPLYSDGVVDQMILYIASSGELQRLRRSDDDVFRYETSEKVGQIEVLGWSALGVSDQVQDYVFYGDAQFWYLPSASDSWSKRVIGSYETELEDVHYTHIESADFDGDGRVEIVAVDGQKHVVELLSKEANAWESLMYWEIFEQNMHYQGRQGGKLEPRQTIIADLTGDGALDFAFLIHDRILFYPQSE
ncbi:MAG: FG-GAP repeat domain-containing protein [Opitutaceae bacterium]